MTKPKRIMFGHVARLAHAFSSPVRVEIVDLLVQAPRSADDLARLTEQSRANISQHLQVLRAAGAIVSRREGRNVISDVVENVIPALYQTMSWATDLLVPEATLTRQRHYMSLDPEPPVAIEDLARVLEEGSILIDVRPEEEYRHAHIGGAISLPVYDLADRLPTLPEETPYLAYCRGPQCTYAYEAVDLLRRRGRRARRLKGGYLGWRVATGAGTAPESVRAGI